MDPFVPSGVHKVKGLQRLHSFFFLNHEYVSKIKGTLYG